MTVDSSFADRLKEFSRLTSAIRDSVSGAVIGQDRVVKLALSAFLCRGHALIIGAPGLAKTLLVKTLAATGNLIFKRIQFTPDMMPSDITGALIIDDAGGARQFRFEPGPLFANIVLGDEINRAPPKTQAALLEAMAEGQVTVGGETHPLPEPFFVAATQNPIEQEGTYPLPESQLDRFMVSATVDFPSAADERRIYRNALKGDPRQPAPILDSRSVESLRRVVDDIVVTDTLIDYAARIVRLTRPDSPGAPDFVRDLIEWGAGPRAGCWLLAGARAFAALDGRMHVSETDIRDLAGPTLRHRLGLSFQAETQGISADRVIELILEFNDGTRRKG
mgnify:CR=1 FL=1